MKGTSILWELLDLVLRFGFLRIERGWSSYMVWYSRFKNLPFSLTTSLKFETDVV